MGVYDKLDDLRKQRDSAKLCIVLRKQEYVESKRQFRVAELALKRAKYCVGQHYRGWVEARNFLKRVEVKISSHNTAVRSWNKRHPFEMFGPK